MTADDLDRFVTAQEPVYRRVLDELRRGAKRSHWMWFVFPQIAGLGLSSTSQYYAIVSLAQARTYLQHAVLGTRLRECASIVAQSDAASAEQIFGEVDAMKLRSSMTLFHLAAPDEPVFSAVLERYFGGALDPATVDRARD
jgi:uncharacterized protein (DUF1810 family)